MRTGLPTTPSNTRPRLKQPDFLPMSPQELQRLGWSSLDVLLISGDAYVDHPSFGIALLGRVLVEHGYTVAVVAQPPWQGVDAANFLRAFPRPRLFAGVSAGAVDSMLAHYTAFRKKRFDDAYTPGGKAGRRPNRACTVYTGLVRQAFPGLPVILGGIEASLRRVTHYDFWADDLRRSVLLDSKADLILCGMAEDALRQAADAADLLTSQCPLSEAEPNAKKNKDAYRKAFSAACRAIPNAVTVMSRSDFESSPYAAALRVAAFKTPGTSTPADAAINPLRPAILLPSHEDIVRDPAELLRATVQLERICHQATHTAVQHCGDRTIILSPPPPPAISQALDSIYDLPFARLPHPSYKAPIPAWEMIRTSITTHRGCAGGCSFCSLALHQGRLIASRSKRSILQEAMHIAAGPRLNYNEKPATAKAPKWASSISDVGGPSANMWLARCTLDSSRCKRASCLFPGICPGFQAPQREDVKLLRDVANLPGVRHVRVASGVRYDMALQDMEVLKAYSMEFTGGQLKIAPEHICDDVLRLMRKPSQVDFEKFINDFALFSRQAGKEQYVIPYLISAFPGCTDEHMRTLKRWLEKRGWSPKQVQCFIPTPCTVATAMFYCGRDTDGHAIPVARTDKDRMRQHYILLGETQDEYSRPERNGDKKRKRPACDTTEEAFRFRHAQRPHEKKQPPRSVGRQKTESQKQTLGRPDKKQR